LLVFTTSPGTAPTSTLIVALLPNAVCGRLNPENFTDCCWAGWIRGIVCFFVIGVPPASIVSVTGTLVSWKSPESSTVTTNARSADTFSVGAELADRSTPCGVTCTPTSASPCLPLGVPVTEAPLSRWTSRPNERALTRSVFGTSCDFGITTPVTPSFTSCCVAGNR